MKRARQIKHNYIRVERNLGDWWVFLVVGIENYRIGTSWSTKSWANMSANSLAKSLDAIVEEYTEADTLACMYDTDGDGNCEKHTCPHCHPEHQPKPGSKDQPHSV